MLNGIAKWFSRVTGRVKKVFDRQQYMELRDRLLLSSQGCSYTKAIAESFVETELDAIFESKGIVGARLCIKKFLSDLNDRFSLDVALPWEDGVIKESIRRVFMNTRGGSVYWEKMSPAIDAMDSEQLLAFYRFLQAIEEDSRQEGKKEAKRHFGKIH